MFSGAVTALVTPFTDDGGAVDYTVLDALIDRQIEAGIQGIAPCGCTGEAATLSHEEQEKVIRHTIERVNGRCKVIAGTGSNNTAEAVRLTRLAADAGADAAMVITPYYNKPTPEGQFRHYQAVAEAGNLPIMVYNVPGRTGTKIAPETVARMFKEIEQVRMIKEACGSVDQASAILKLCEIALFSGDDMLTVPMMAVGASGIVSVSGNLVPEKVVALCKAMQDGEWAQARKLHYEILDLHRAMFIETNPMPVKTALRMMGLGNGVMRMPLCEMTEAGEAALRTALQAHQIPLKA